MKTISKIFSAAIVMFAAISCQSIDEGKVVTRQLEVSGTIVGEDETKVTYEITNDKDNKKYSISPKWTVGDQIIGFDNDGKTFTFTVSGVSGDGKYATFSYDDTKYTPPIEGTLYAIYAPGYAETAISGKTLSINLSTHQWGVLDGAAPVLMCATGTISGDKVNFQFENKTAIIGVTRFKLNDVTAATTVNSMTLNGVVTEGKFEVDETSGNLKLTATGGPSSITATAKGNEWTTNESGVCTTAVYFAAIPTESAKLVLNATVGGTEYANVNSIDSKTLDEGRYYHMSKILDEPVAKIGDIYYGTIDEAFAASDCSNANCTVTLLADCGAAAKLSLNSDTGSGTVTLDLNGHKLTTITTDYGILVDNRTLTIEDNSQSGTGVIESKSTDKYLLYTSHSARVTISSGTLTTSYRAICVQTNAQVDINGTSAISAEDYGVMSYGTLNVSGNAAITSDLYGIYVSDGTAEISGGTIEAVRTAIYVKNDGSVLIKGDASVSSTNPNYALINANTENQSQVIIEGGRFSAPGINPVSGSGNRYVTGGVFNRPVNNLATNDKSDNKYYNSLNTDPGTKNDYPYCVVSSESAGVSLIATSSISTTSATFGFDHASFESAIKHGTISNNDITIAMNDNVTWDSSIDLTNQNGNTITFDINGKTVTSHASPAFTTSTSLTIKDSQSQDSKGILQSDQIQILYVSSGLPDIVLDGCFIYCTADPSDAGYVIQINSEDSKSSSRPNFTAQNNAIVVSTGSSVRAIGSTNSSVGANYTLEDCYITSKHRAVFGSTGTVITINEGASIYSENEEPVYLGSTKSGSKMTINDGYFYGSKGVNCSSGANVTINGGYFNCQVGASVSTKLQELGNAVNHDHYTTPASFTNFSYGFSKSN